MFFRGVVNIVFKACRIADTRVETNAVLSASPFTIAGMISPKHDSTPFTRPPRPRALTELSGTANATLISSCTESGSEGL